MRESKRKAFSTSTRSHIKSSKFVLLPDEIEVALVK